MGRIGIVGIGKNGAGKACTLTLGVTFAMAATACFADALRPAPFFGILQNSPANFVRNAAAGARMGHLSLHWDRYFPTDATRDETYVAEKQSELLALHAAGLEIMLDLGLQYPPAWVYELPNSRFINQYGEAYLGGIGETGVNAVFNAGLRRKQAEFVRAALATFGPHTDIVRLGFMRYGELGYPHPHFGDHDNSYWAYDDLAQGKSAGLPEGVMPCPVPGWRPGQPSENHEDAQRFAAWYVAALKNYHDWQIDVVGGLFQGRLTMLYPSWGIRPSQVAAAVLTDLDGSTPAEKNGEIQRAHDFERFIAGIANPRVLVCGTWVDANPAWSDDGAATPRNPCPIHHLATLARNHPLRLGVIGENTGGGGIDAMDLAFTRAADYGLDGLMWAFEADLYDGKPPTLADLTERISTFRAAARGPR